MNRRIASALLCLPAWAAGIPASDGSASWRSSPPEVKPPRARSLGRNPGGRDSGADIEASLDPRKA